MFVVKYPKDTEVTVNTCTYSIFPTIFHPSGIRRALRGPRKNLYKIYLCTEIEVMFLNLMISKLAKKSAEKLLKYSPIRRLFHINIRIRANQIWFVGWGFMQRSQFPATTAEHPVCKASRPSPTELFAAAIGPAENGARAFA